MNNIAEIMHQGLFSLFIVIIISIFIQNVVGLANKSNRSIRFQFLMSIFFIWISDFFERHISRLTRTIINYFFIVVQHTYSYILIYF